MRFCSGRVSCDWYLPLLSRCRLWLILVSLLSSPNSIASESVRWAAPNYLLDSFVEIALHNEYSSKQKGVRKWTQPVKYQFVHRVADQELHERLSILHLEHLASLTGVDIQPTTQKQEANLLIVFSSENQFEKELENDFRIASKAQRRHLFRSSVCMAHFSVRADNSIRKAMVIIPVDRARAHAKLVSCIVEELTQVMGLPNDSDKVYPSIFNDKTYNQLLTGLDYLLLKMLYSPNVKAGMSLEKVKPVLRATIKEFERQGLLAQAQKKVMDGGLYPLLY